ncbi:MAG: PIN domain-containing protein [Bacteroidales bacterium]|nr:PIN domain-containing protein [Bacteroidales bacterium]
MKDKSFIDTNILVYCYSSTEPAKKEIAIKVSNPNNVYLSTQVLKEFVNVLSKKFKFSWKSISKAIDEVESNFLIFINHPNTIKNACDIADKYQYSYYDSLIIASALEAGCTTLYTEDLQHKQLIEGKLRIVNPFIA